VKVRRLSSKRYHRRLITDPFDTFENRETTFSHRFREPHAFLGGLGYGEALFRALHLRGLAGLRQVLEVGGGTGDLARGFLKAWRRASPRGPRRYILMDLSGALLGAQRAAVRRDPAFRQVHGDAERLPFRDGSLGGLVLANEMIADLDAWEIRQARGTAGLPRCLGANDADFNPALVRRVLRRHGLGRMPPGLTVFPRGLERFLAELHRAMRPGAMALLTEYFHRSRGAVVRLPRHTEAALGLDLTCRLAARAGFSMNVMDLGDLIGLRVGAPVLAHRHAVFFRDVLDLPCSTTLPYGKRRVRRMAGCGDDPGGLLSSGELTAFAGRFKAVLLTRRRAVGRAAWGPSLVLERDPATLMLRARSGEPHLLKPHPFTHVKPNPTGAFLWRRLDGRASAGRLARALARGFSVTPRRALADTLAFLGRLHRLGLVHASLKGTPTPLR
jgi:SAM-dependent methyltransferase